MRVAFIGLASGLLGAIALGLGVLVLIERAQLTELSQQRDRLARQLSARESQRLDAAKRDCATRSGNLYRALGFSENPPQTQKGPHAEEFSDHYSKRLGRCLIEITVTDISTDGGKAREIIQKMIYDADERRQFGAYDWVSSDTKKYWEQKPIECHMTPPDKDEAFCNSTAQWENFEQELMSS